ncbi:hypothetical protein CATRI_03375 [Corynebacterium atrinae]|uniref:septation protein SepH n=1 Tax=Corynebacterium atrinae TaxID=1336740 RepID=UPI0025B2830F|nr:septation protein SepH [Corynebacterium atrinae]WJY62774.1 hypothetical protein CATRI_03375 [Corynebacterium atrinae]
MRELFLVNEDSTDTSLVLRAEDGEQFFVAVDSLDDAARTSLLAPPAVETPAEPEPEEAVVEVERSIPAPDPLLTTPLTMRPRDIQGRIRSGASIADLAEEMGVAESRVEPFAHPVILERQRMAELAKQAHPIREDGPAKLTLWEVLATAFAARGQSVADSTWDAYREPTGKWVVRVSWTAGLSDNEAEWTVNNHASSASTAEARNAIAADLTDPDFVQPVRTLTSVGRGNRYEEEPDDLDFEGDGVAEGEEFLRHPDPEDKPAASTKRRRKAVTPHWEDVLLGVRTNTKRPRG